MARGSCASGITSFEAGQELKGNGALRPLIGLNDHHAICNNNCGTEKIKLIKRQLSKRTWHIYICIHIYTHTYMMEWDFPGGSDGKVSVYNAGDLGSIPGLGRFPGEGNGNPLQYSCLENPMDGGAWCRLLSMGLKESGTTERLPFPFPFPMMEYFCCWVAKSCPTLVTPWTVAHQTLLSMGFPGKNTGVGFRGLLLSHKNNEILSFPAPWMDLENTILNELSQQRKTNVITYM